MIDEFGEHAADVERLQRWLWAAVKSGWSPTAPKNSRWSHDDNMAAQPLGWMIVTPPNSTFLALMSLKPRVTAQELYKNIAEMAPIHPLCAKAFAVLTAQRLEHPTRKFEYAAD